MNKKNTENIQNSIKKSLDFENTLTDIRRKNEKRAWIVAGISTFTSLCLIGGLIYILPLKQREPYLVMADVYTGQASVAKLTGNWNNNRITKYEAIDKSNISHFIIARESFDSQLIYDNDWVTVYSMSESNVSGSYRSMMNKGNPQSPFNLYGSAQSIRVKILSIVLNNSGKSDKRDASATVRFQRFVLNKSNGISNYLDSNVATLTYKYNDNLAMEEKYRIVNPLGFQVTSYRVDPDSTVPIAHEAPTYVHPEIENNLANQIASAPKNASNLIEKSSLSTIPRSEKKESNK